MDIEFKNVTLTGCARVRLRRHPSTNITFSMVIVFIPVKEKIIKMDKRESFSEISANSPFHQLHGENTEKRFI